MGTPALLCVSLVLWGLLGKCTGIPLMPKDKRGWTLNSAGYLLGPHAHRPLMGKGGLAGKREAAEKPMHLGAEFDSAPLHPPDESSLQTLLDFLSSLHLPALGALDRLSLPDVTFQA